MQRAAVVLLQESGGHGVQPERRAAGAQTGESAVFLMRYQHRLGFQESD